MNAAEITFCGMDEAAVLDRIECGMESISKIAASCGKNRSSLWRWLNTDPERSARARSAMVAASGAWDEEAERRIADATDAFELAKAKEIAHHLRWRASKIAPKVYGDKMTVAGDSESPLVIEIVKFGANQPT